MFVDDGVMGFSEMRRLYSQLSFWAVGLWSADGLRGPQAVALGDALGGVEENKGSSVSVSVVFCFVCFCVCV